ncbi:hypothetical protein LBMAG42_47320 [Deltaproteobacteria bacterium]|nr:hypothetical protein LBMAG42_47320 [Deltaproteobacteria bacterium]
MVSSLRGVALLLFGCALLELPACKPDAPPDPAGLVEAPAELVSAHTSGVIGRRSPIEVRFVHDVVEESAVGQPASAAAFSLAPTVPGTLVWTGRAVLAFQPTEALKPGETYTAHVDLPALLPKEAAAKAFDLQVTVVEQDFHAELLGLAADGDAAHQTFSGRLTLADEAEPAAVEKMLSAEHGNDTLTYTWEHQPGNRDHSFVIHGLIRPEDASTLKLTLDGSPVGLDRSDAHEVEMPGLNQFVVSAVRAETSGDRHIEIRFSDPLLEKQDLNGLIRVEGRPDVQVQRDGSVVRIYSSSGWSDTESVVIVGVRNTSGFALKTPSNTTVSFAPLKPSVRFATGGVILPSTANLTIPLEATNVSAIEVEATQVYEENVPQFLQVNTLEGSSELKRVGRVVWSERVEIAGGSAAYNVVQHIGLDVSKLVKDHPTGLYRLSVRFKRADILLDCPEQTWVEADDPAADWDDPSGEKSFWDYFESDGDGEGESGWSAWEHRDDPCRRAFYLPSYDHDLTASKNVLISDVGLIAKQGVDGQLVAVATDLVKAAPLVGANLQLLDYQLQTIATGVTGADGTVRLPAGDVRPFALVAKSGGQAGWLRLDKGAALATSHFDVGGAALTKGLEGYIYGERGIWRPGDDIFLTFMLRDSSGKLSGKHPAEFELENSRGQVVERRTVTDPMDGMYRLTTRTAADAPTGNYTARVRVGGATFEKSLRVETVVPNRLKIALDVKDTVKAANLQFASTLEARWLHGAPAPGFRADIAMKLTPKATTFPKYGDYTFDDPLANFSYEPATIWEGELDEAGKVKVNAEIPAPVGAPGLLSGTMVTRVFEPSGAFSVDEATVTVSPHERYVGLQLEKGDAARGMLLTDVKHPTKLVLLDEDGKPVPDGQVEASLYKIEWRWWWEKGPDSLAEYAEARNLQPLQTGTVAVKNGVATWDFEVKFPDWGRYLVVAKDKTGTHRAGKIVYIDWPGWAGRARADQPGGASVLAVTSDTKKTEVGKPITLSFPMAKGSRALVSLETGAKVLDMKWVEPSGSGDVTTFTFDATPEMAPGVYANVTVVQPYGTKANDAPIRLYGIVPIEVFDPGTKLTPKIATASVFAPESTALVSVSEAAGRTMTYTLAVVDEGLLGLTRFQTPDAWGTFYQRKALGVRSWDLFDMVAGAYGGALDSTLGVGGDGEGLAGKQPQAQRFKPMVAYLGPFTLAAGETKKHEVKIPQYVGEVRVMVVAGHDGAYGAAEQSVPVKKPLMVLASLPRVLGPKEEVELPISVFALEAKVKDVTVTVDVEGPLSIVGEKKRTLKFANIGDKLSMFKLVVGDTVGVVKVHVTATGGGETAKQDVELDVRHPGSPETRVLSQAVKPGATWNVDVALPGLPGTNESTLELSRVPPLELDRRLDDLIAYPHGCIEQTTSSVFPQVYLSQLTELSPAYAKEVESNVKAGITRLRSFQNADGGFGYWPGEASNEWGSTYAGHFLVEAERAGYSLPSGMRSGWLKYQHERANRWVKDHERSDLEQAYRLYTLALAGQPDIGAMNRLKEVNLTPAARWRLGAAYLLAGQKATAQAVIAKVGVDVTPYHELSGTFGSQLRDQAMILEATVLMGDLDKASRLAGIVSNGLTADGFMSTQESAYALVAMARFAGMGGVSESMSASWSLDGSAAKEVSTTRPVVLQTLSVKQAGTPKVSVTNKGAKPLFARVVTRGIPAIGNESAEAKGLTLVVEYLTPQGEAVDVSGTEHGADLIAHVTVTNTSGMKLDELALSEVFPSGWQINGAEPGRGEGYDYRDVRDDRVYTYFDLAPGAAAEFKVPVNASYAGKYYLPAVTVGAMYDASVVARQPGQWIVVAGMPQG